MTPVSGCETGMSVLAEVSFFLDGIAGCSLVKQIILLLNSTSIVQTGWNIEQSEEISQHRRPQAQEEKAKSAKALSLFTRAYTRIHTHTSHRYTD